MTDRTEECRDCKFFYLFLDRLRGVCRRHPPSVNFQRVNSADQDTEEDDQHVSWPTLGSENWCGDFTKASPEEIAERTDTIAKWLHAHVED